MPPVRPTAAHFERATHCSCRSFGRFEGLSSVYYSLKSFTSVRQNRIFVKFCGAFVHSLLNLRISSVLIFKSHHCISFTNFCYVFCAIRLISFCFCLHQSPTWMARTQPQPNVLDGPAHSFGRTPPPFLPAALDRIRLAEYDMFYNLMLGSLCSRLRGSMQTSTRKT